jgi:hypothetical protein
LNEISVSPVGSFGRTFIFPDVSPDAFAASKDATPTGPVLYLSWPAWENFRLRRLGQSPPTEGLTPIMTADPPNFAASLAAMLEAAQDGTPVPTPPMRPEDSAEAI